MNRQDDSFHTSREPDALALRRGGRRRKLRTGHAWRPRGPTRQAEGTAPDVELEFRTAAPGPCATTVLLVGNLPEPAGLLAGAGAEITAPGSVSKPGSAWTSRHIPWCAGPGTNLLLTSHRAPAPPG